jgi:hypothetical protein
VTVKWSPEEMAEAMRAITQALLSEAMGRESSGLVLANPLIVRYYDRHAKLTPTEHALVRYVHSRGPADFDEVRQVVWMKNVSDKRIANVCSEITGKFSDVGMPFEVSAEGSVVSIRKI